MDRLDKLPVKGKKTRVVNPRIVTADEHNSLIESVNTLIDEVTLLDAPFTEEEADAIKGSNSPSAGNVFATMDDLPIPDNILTEDQLGAISGASNPSEANPFLTEEFVDVVPNSLNYRKYAVFITQTGTNTPTVTVLESQFAPLPIVWARTGVGVYTATLSPVFVLNKTIPNSNPELYVDSVTGNKITAVRTSADVITLTTTDDEDTPIDGALTDRYFEIIVYK